MVALTRPAATIIHRKQEMATSGGSWVVVSKGPATPVSYDVAGCPREPPDVTGPWLRLRPLDRHPP
jgi:hypothetical protein